jgi:hypothetical protein
MLFRIAAPLRAGEGFARGVPGASTLLHERGEVVRFFLPSGLRQGRGSDVRGEAPVGHAPPAALDEQPQCSKESLWISRRESEGGVGGLIIINTGTAACFFSYVKTSRSERGKGDKYPCVKPLSLMR